MEPPSWRQSIDFWFKVLVIPYYLIGSFMWGWIGVHFWIGLPIVFYSVAMTVTESAQVAIAYKQPRYSLYSFVLHLQSFGTHPLTVSRIYSLTFIGIYSEVKKRKQRLLVAL